MGKSKINGEEIISLLEDLVKGKLTVNPFSMILDEDLSNDDVSLKFKEKGGCKCAETADQDTLTAVLADLNKSKRLIKTSGYRNLFNLIQNALKNASDPIVIERVASSYKTYQPGVAQSKAYNLAQELYTKASTEKETKRLGQIQELILDGDDACLRTASKFTKELHDMYVPHTSERLAFVSVYEQMNQPYQMCPKGLYVFGHAIPIEIQKCRENCIDVKMSQDGTVGCSYSDWLKVADNHEKAMARLEVHVNVPEEVRMELKDGERAKDLMPYETTTEQRIDSERSKKPKTFNSLEFELNKAYPREKPVKKSKEGLKDESKFDDSTIEQLLASEHEVFSDEELDILEAQLDKERE